MLTQRPALVFFYGLFMDPDVLRPKGLAPQPPSPDERNPEYAAKLRALAERLGLPGDYVASIR